MRYSKLLLLTIALLLSARVPEVAQPSAQKDCLAGTEWKLVSFGKPGAESPTVEGTTVTIKFSADGKAGGSGGCNSYGGQYQVRDDSLSLSRIISTKRACLAQGTMQQEQRYFEALAAAGKFKLADKQLTISYDEGRGALNFVTNTPESAEQ